MPEGPPRTPARRSWLCVAVGALLFLVMPHISGCAPDTVSPAVETRPPLPPQRIEKQWVALSRKPPSGQGPLTVERAIEEALSASPELEQIRQRLAAADEQVVQAGASFYPRLVVSERFNITNNPVFALMNIINQRRLRPDVNFNDPGKQQDFATQVGIQWSLFEGGKTYYGREAALGNRSSVEASLSAARNQLVSKVTETYYRWLQALGFIGVARASLRSAETDVSMGEARLEAEMALPSEIMRLKAHLAEIRGNLVTARTGARRLQAALERLMARPIHETEIPEPGLALSPAEIASPDDDTDSMVKKALMRRPELEAIRSMVLASQKRVLAEKGDLFPKVGANAFYQWNTETFSEMEGSWLLGIDVTWALFEGGVTRSRIRESRLRLKEIEAKGEQIALDIALEVHQAALAVQEAAEKIKAAHERKRWAQGALNEVREQYKNQVVTVDTLLQAEVASNRAQVAYTAALFDGKIAQAALRQALGDFADWTEDQDVGKRKN